MKLIIIFVILVTSAFAAKPGKGLKSFNDFAIDTDISQVKPDYSPKTVKIELTEEELRRLDAEKRQAELRRLQAAQGENHEPSNLQSPAI